ncbi:MAG: DUF4339 domain-containing protein [Verrucomicrobia bacterium]|nr:DUF4339 domain-containing protein [Verrucomicrobiota bacterium]
MYFIQGADQKEYGPVSADQLRQWIRENRLNRFSAARAEGEATWKTLGDLPEFAEALGLPAPVPVAPPAPPAPTAPPSPLAPTAPPAAPAPPPTSYFIQGADQKEYGPIAADQLRQWITENRLNRFSPARAEGEATWKTLGDLPEFADLLGGPAPIATPTATATSPTRPASSPGGWASSSAPSGSGLRSAPGISETVVDEKLRIPAIGILTSGAVGAMLSFYGLVSGLSDNARQEIPPGMPPEFERMFKAYLAFAEAYAVPQNALALVLSLLSLLAGVRMLQRKSYGLVMAGVILTTIPCVSPCCCLGLPFGIWALVVLSNTEVKAAFR